MYAVIYFADMRDRAPLPVCRASVSISLAVLSRLSGYIPILPTCGCSRATLCCSSWLHLLRILTGQFLRTPFAPYASLPLPPPPPPATTTTTKVQLDDLRVRPHGLREDAHHDGDSFAAGHDPSRGAGHVCLDKADGRYACMHACMRMYACAQLAVGPVRIGSPFLASICSALCRRRLVVLRFCSLSVGRTSACLRMV